MDSHSEDILTRSDDFRKCLLIILITAIILLFSSLHHTIIPYAISHSFFNQGVDLHFQAYHKPISNCTLQYSWFKHSLNTKVA